MRRTKAKDRAQGSERSIVNNAPAPRTASVDRIYYDPGIDNYLS